MEILASEVINGSRGRYAMQFALHGLSRLDFALWSTGRDHAGAYQPSHNIERWSFNGRAPAGNVYVAWMRAQSSLSFVWYVLSSTGVAIREPIGPTGPIFGCDGM